MTINMIFIRVIKCRNYESALTLTRRRGAQIYRRFGARGLPVADECSSHPETKCSHSVPSAIESYEPQDSNAVSYACSRDHLVYNLPDHFFPRYHTLLWGTGNRC